MFWFIATAYISAPGDAELMHKMKETIDNQRDTIRSKNMEIDSLRKDLEAVCCSHKFVRDSRDSRDGAPIARLHESRKWLWVTSDSSFLIRTCFKYKPNPKDRGKRGNIVAETSLLIMFLGNANEREAKQMFCFLLRKPRNVSRETLNIVSSATKRGNICCVRKMFLKKFSNIFCVSYRNKCCVRGQTRKHWFPQQCVCNNQFLFFFSIALAVRKANCVTQKHNNSLDAWF